MGTPANTPVMVARASVVALVVLLAGCTATSAVPAAAPPTSTAGSTGTDLSRLDGSGILPGYQDQTTLQFSPLIISALSPEVVPVKGSDGVYYVAYELSVFNAAARDATMTSVETLAGDERGEVIATRDQESVAAITVLIASTSAGTAEIPSGRTAVLVFRDTYPTEDAIPETFTHRIDATFAPAGPDAPRLASKYPDEVSQMGGALVTSAESALVIGPPVTGADWFALNALDSHALNFHSDVVIPVGGRLVPAEQYAIDFVVIDSETMMSARGDPTLNSSYLAFDQPLIAVADATVVRVVSDHPDVAPLEFADLKLIDDATGNQIVLDLGDGVFAMYAHMKEDSAVVAVGDTVKKGQEIGRLGNSGNTSEAHLHFQLQRGPLLSADNVAWVIDEFTATGVVAPDGHSVVDPPNPGVRKDEIPVTSSISDFAALRP